MKIQIKPYSHEDTDFHDEQISNVGSDCNCLARITVDSALKNDKNDKNDYPQVFLKECKYIETEKIRNIIGDEEISSYESEEG